MYLSLQLVELGYVVQHRRQDRNYEQEPLAGEVLEGMHYGEVALDGDRHGDENRADPADVTEAKAHRKDEDIDRPGVPVVRVKWR